ncbi:MAG: hypothetical protein NUV52_04600 [Candidatus Roizmanbacteria bacterium]|nr:hypothetical protein [Candidatus Roizmanbacteria bacterium]
MEERWRRGFDLPEPKKLRPILARAGSWEDVFPLNEKAYRTVEQRHQAQERMRGVAVQHFSETVEQVIRSRSRGKLINYEGGINTSGGYYKRETDQSEDDFTCYFTPEGNLAFRWKHDAPDALFEWADYIPYHVGHIRHAHTHQSIDDLLAQFKQRTKEFKVRIADERMKSEDGSIETWHQREVTRISGRIEGLERHLLGYFATESIENDIIDELGDRPLRVGYLLYPANALRVVHNVNVGYLRPDNL